MKKLLLAWLLFSPIESGAGEGGLAFEELNIEGVDLAASVQYSETLNDNGEPFDPYFRDELVAKRAVQDAVCKVIKSFTERLDCITDVSNQFVRAGRMRGTIEFARMNYLSFDNVTLAGRISELEEYLKHAESFYVGKKPLGVLTRPNLETEIREIQRIIGLRNRAELIAGCEKIFGEGHSRCRLP